MNLFKMHYILLILLQSTDEGDGIVPSTPTLINRRDDSYQAISSPRVPPQQQQFRFRFEDLVPRRQDEDVSASQTFAAVPGGSQI